MSCITFLAQTSASGSSELTGSAYDDTAAGTDAPNESPPDETPARIDCSFLIRPRCEPWADERELQAVVEQKC